jgi:hypothetical protein
MMKTRIQTCLLLSMLAASPAHTMPRTPDIRIDDVERFYAIYDAAGGKPAAEVLQRDYLDKGSVGLGEFAKLRNITGVRIADAIARQPALFAEARGCAALLPRVKQRLGAALVKLGEIYPEARFPAVTVAVSRGKPVGVGNASGVYIGLEALCDWDTPGADREDRFVHVIAHEYVHVQQAAKTGEDPSDTVLKASLAEGGAEFIAELIAGAVAYKHLAPAVRGKEAELEAEFLRDADKTAIGSNWLYNGIGTPERPGDLGYWVGYRIAKAYYRNAADKRAAVRDIIELHDPKAFLARSGCVAACAAVNATTDPSGSAV